MAHPRVALVQGIIKSIENLEPGFKTAFLAAISDLKSTAVLSQVAESIKAGRVDDVIQVLNLKPEFFAPLDDAIRTSFSKGGQSVIQQPGLGRLGIRFGGTNPRAQLWVQSHSSTLITAIVADQRQAVRTVVEAGIRGGVNPRDTARNIVGRIDKATGRRTGGILGLTNNQTSFVTNARGELQSGDVGRMRNYLTRRQRDKRFDPVVRRAIAAKQPVSAKDASRITDRYSDKLLKLRGDTIARTESLAAFNAGRQEGLNQIVDSGAVKPEQVRRIWRTSIDSRVRDTHQAMNGEVVGLKQEFSNGLMFPAAPGGRPEEVINCRCIIETKIDFLAGAAPPAPVPPKIPPVPKAKVSPKPAPPKPAPQDLKALAEKSNLSFKESLAASKALTAKNLAAKKFAEESLEKALLANAKLKASNAAAKKALAKQAAAVDKVAAKAAALKEAEIQAAIKASAARFAPKPLPGISSQFVTKPNAAVTKGAVRPTPESVTGSIGGIGPNTAERGSLRIYSGPSYRSINGFLRGKIDDITPRQNSAISNIDDVMNRTFVMEKETVTYRGMKLSPRTKVENYKVGQEFVDFGYVSSSKSARVASEFIGPSKRGILFRITNPKGTKALDMAQSASTTVFKKEAEVLLARGTKMKITHITDGRPHATIIVHVRIIEQGLERAA